MYPSEYVYHEDSVYRDEKSSANCRNYPSSLGRLVWSEDYIHCDGTPLRLTDSDYGSEQYTISDYYVWPAGSRSQLLFIFPTRVNLATITLHYYNDGVRDLPRLRFYAVPDDFDFWNAPHAGYSHVDVAAVPPSGESSGHRNVSINYNIVVDTNKILLLLKFSSSSSFVMSEVEFFTCTGKSCSRFSSITVY